SPGPRVDHEKPVIGRGQAIARKHGKTGIALPVGIATNNAPMICFVHRRLCFRPVRYCVEYNFCVPPRKVSARWIIGGGWISGGGGAERGQRADLEQVILRLRRQRKEGASICPSDAARAARPQ